jgi:predicted transcriptional regulator
MTMPTTEPVPSDALTVTRLLLDLDLRSERQRLGLAAWQLADRLGVSESCITRWELGSRQPRAALLLRLTALLAQLRRDQHKPPRRQQVAAKVTP